ncbi:hypothetical protein [Chitinophaga pinensis]|uniref:Uncharacterized protein n=1 Tax=Chitinophaga pinensis (strain ATCC 43595 / DSM 2588 / LMG 13176 / NBRC 15968 / NCIMB 11800 / UQM 2034) TaxID=485918 RepID=A0A979G2T1_CHIPD|nr:hypothetical protein [Chitinophaga pinensis]ACU59548.1 hypothetical protein Cpin_2053 [Chitinophaga pinensis DSM 2588]
MKHIFCLSFLLVGYFAGFGQTTKKSDVIVRSNGDILNGEVHEITDSTIRFTYSGEKLVYTIKKSDILKITFASGRTEAFNNMAPQASSTQSAPAPQPQAAMEDTRNKVAILPFSFVKDGQNLAEEVSEEVQNECYAMLGKHAGVHTLMSPRATNVALNKAGINRSNIKNYSMSELCQILGVEYVIDGMISQNRTTQTNYGTTSYSDKSKDDDKKKSGTASTYSTNVQNYQTVMDMKIYNEKSEIIYNQNRKAFWQTEDAYKNTLEYLIKRCPLYTK